MNVRHFQLFGAGALLLVSGIMALHGDLTVEDRVARMSGELDPQIASRAVHVDPGELLDLMNNNQLRISILDARSEAEFNLFHLRDALRVGPMPEYESPAMALPPGSVKVVVSNDEERADTAWKRLRAIGVMNVYVLSGGLRGWFDVYGDGELFGDIDEALGDRNPVAAPDPFAAPEREYEKKVEVVMAAASAGGCG